MQSIPPWRRRFQKKEADDPGPARTRSPNSPFPTGPEVRKKFPQVALRLQTVWRRELLELARSGVIDAAVILLPAGEALPHEVTGKQVGNERLVLVGSRRKRLQPFRRLQGLLGAQWILNPQRCAALPVHRQRRRSGSGDFRTETQILIPNCKFGKRNFELMLPATEIAALKVDRQSQRITSPGL